MGRLARAPLLALALLLFCADARADEPPTFLIERVVVEGLERESARQIVLSESRLVEGGTYSEPQLRDAVSRVKRLPFVVDANMALRKGSERGAYELLITVEAAKPVAFALDVDGFYFDRPHLRDDGPNDDEIAGGAAFTVSARKFVGAHGLLFGSVQAFDDDLGVGTFQLGYTRYGLFGAGSYASGALSSAVGDRYDKGNLQASAQLGIPLTGNHALRASAAWTSIESRFGSYGGYSEVQLEEWGGGLEWIYDSTDDPLFATSGRRITGTGGYASRRQTHRMRAGGNGEFDFDQRFSDDSWLLSVQGRQYWPVTPKQSLGLGAGAGHSESFDVTGGSTGVYVEAIHAFNVWDFAIRERRGGDLRLETVARVDSSRYSSDSFDYDALDGQLRTSLLFRNAWGVYRLSFSYVAELEGGR